MHRLLLVLSLAACSDRPTPPPAPETGKSLYAMACARCHGVRGAGDGPKRARLGAIPSLERALDPADVRTVIVQGRGQMPPHGKRLTARQIDLIVDYVGTFAP